MTRLDTMLFSALVLATGCQPAGEVVGPRGGTVVSEDGRFSVEIAPGALDREVEITIETIPCGEMTGVAIGSCYEVGPRGTAFSFPAKVTFELDDDQIAGVTADRLALSGQKQNAWALLADRTVDVEDGTVCGSATYLSSFAVVAVDLEATPKAERDPAGT
jgi:hypothetical protein